MNISDDDYYSTFDQFIDSIGSEEEDEESLIVVYIYCFLLIVGILSNAIVLLVTFTDQLRQSSSIYIINLMVSDIIFLISLPFKIDYRSV